MKAYELENGVEIILLGLERMRKILPRVVFKFPSLADAQERLFFALSGAGDVKDNLDACWASRIRLWFCNFFKTNAACEQTAHLSENEHSCQSLLVKEILPRQFILVC